MPQLDWPAAEAEEPAAAVESAGEAPRSAEPKALKRYLLSSREDEIGASPG